MGSYPLTGGSTRRFIALCFDPGLIGPPILRADLNREENVGTLSIPEWHGRWWVARRARTLTLPPLPSSAEANLAPMEDGDMTPATYNSISEIYRADTDEFVPPLDAWEIEIVERDLHEEFGDIGGRESFVANARVRVIEPDGSEWEGLTRLE